VIKYEIMKQKLNLIKKIIFYFKPFKWYLLLIFLIIFIQRSLTNFSSFFLGKVVDAFTQNSFDLVMYFAGIYFVLKVLPIVFDRVAGLLEVIKTDFSLYHHIGRISLRKSLNLSLGQIKNEHSGVKLDVLKNGENALDQLQYIFIYEIIPVISSLLVALIGLTYINKNFFFAATLFILVYLYLNHSVNTSMKEPIRKNIELRKEKSKIYTDLFRNLFFIKFSGQNDFAVKQLKKYQDKHETFGIKIWVNYHKRMIISDFLQVIFFAFVIFYTVYAIQNSLITIGMFLPITIWVGQISNSLQQLRHVQRRLIIDMSDLEKMFEMLERKTDIFISENPMNIKLFEDKIKFENISFDYNDGKKGAMKNVSFEIKKGEKVALVGKSGSGKSTIVSLLLRLYDPSNGDILVDGIALKELNVNDWYKLIAYVPQDGDLIDMTIRENVLFGANGKTRKNEVENALTQAQAYDFVSKLPKGIDTTVGERGVKLSGGQKQRICIARALVKDAQILILDEATSSLDSETEQFLNKNIWEILSDKTGIVIAHRLSTILDADKIIVIDDGKIVGVGNHKKLLKECEFYKTLVDAQNISF
jgi:ABC-type multidrug transport system fused ATPase/permease subunit